MSDWLEVGKKPPAWTLLDENGSKRKSSEFRGAPLVLYFYPKDDTPGCTRQACSFRDTHPQIRKLGATLIGISPDSVDSHCKFHEKYDLTFTLLADPDHRFAELLGAWREKNMYGKKMMGVVRSTFLFDSKGKLFRLWKKVLIDDHDRQVIEALKELRTAES